MTQSDPGTENFGIANVQTMLRQWHDPTLHGTLQHRWMCEKKNVKPEITWSQLRRWFTPGFENILNDGVISGWYDADNTFQKSCFRLLSPITSLTMNDYRMIFHWVFIPWLQQELNAYRDHITAK